MFDDLIDLAASFDSPLVAHLRRAAAMPRPEAGHYLRWMAIGTGRSRFVRKHHARGFIGDTLDRLAAESLILCAAARRLADAGRVHAARVEWTCLWEPAPNPHWPDLSSHGVCVAIEPFRPAADVWRVDVQILPPDEGRTQYCPVRLARGESRARQVAGLYAAVGRAIVAAQERLNAPGQGQLSLFGSAGVIQHGC